MTITPAQLDTLKAVAHHRNAIRVPPKSAAEQWTWQVGGKPRSGTIDRLYMAGFLEAVNRDTLKLSERGRRALGRV